MTPAKWTPDEDAKLIRLFRQGWTLRQIAEELGRTHRSVRSRKRALNAAPVQKSKKYWTEREIEVLRANRHLQNRFVAALLPGRSMYSIERYRGDHPDLAYIRPAEPEPEVIYPPAPGDVFVTVSGIRAVVNKHGISLPYIASVAA